MSPDEIEQLGNRVLAFIFSEVKGNLRGYCNISDIAEAMGILDSEASVVAQYLNTQGLVKIFNMNWDIGITSEGISSLMTKKKDSFGMQSVVNNNNSIIFKGNVNGTQIQQASSNSTQKIEVTKTEKADLQKLIEDLKKEFSKLELDKHKKDEIDVDIKSLELQATSPSPKKSIIKSILEGIKDFAVIAAADTAAVLIEAYLKSNGYI